MRTHMHTHTHMFTFLSWEPRWGTGLRSPHWAGGLACALPTAPRGKCPESSRVCPWAPTMYHTFWALSLSELPPFSQHRSHFNSWPYFSCRAGSTPSLPVTIPTSLLNTDALCSTASQTTLRNPEPSTLLQPSEEQHCYRAFSKGHKTEM